MTDEFLGDRRAALEEAFFAKQNALLRQKLKDSWEARAKKEALAAASGIADDTVLERRGALGRWQHRRQGTTRDPFRSRSGGVGQAGCRLSATRAMAGGTAVP